MPCFCRLNCTSYWSFAVHLTKYLRNILKEGNCIYVISFFYFSRPYPSIGYSRLPGCLNVNVNIADVLVVIEFMEFLTINSLLLCASFHLTVTSPCKMLSGLFHKQMDISHI